MYTRAGGRAGGRPRLSPLAVSVTSLSPRACAASISAVDAASYGFQLELPMKDHCAAAAAGGPAGGGAAGVGAAGRGAVGAFATAATGG